MAGDYAYMVVTDVGLRVVDVRDPARLVEVGALERSEERREGWSRLAVSGGMAVAVEQQVPVTIIDVRNPRQPRRVGEIESVAGDAMDVVIAGDRALVAHRSPRLTVFDLAKLEQLSMYDVTASGELWSVTAEGTTAYLADDRGAMHMLDVSDPDNPRSLRQVGKFDPVHQVVVTALAARSGMGWDVELADNAGLAASEPNLYFGTAHKLGILDLRDPATPRLAAILPIDTVRDVDYTTGIAASGPTVLVMSEVPPTAQVLLLIGVRGDRTRD